MDAAQPPVFVPPTGNRSQNYQPEKYKHPCTWPDCGRKFVCQHNLNQHVREQHSGERPYKCPSCNAAFPRPGSLNRHRNLVHKVENGYGKGRRQKAAAEDDGTGRAGNGKERKRKRATPKQEGYQAGGQPEAKRERAASEADMPLNGPTVMSPGSAGQVPNVPAFDDEMMADDAFGSNQDLFQQDMAFHGPARKRQRRPQTPDHTPADPLSTLQAPLTDADEGTSSFPLDPALTAADTFASPYGEVASEKPHSCPFCVARFKRVEVLALHFHNRHGMPPYHGCTCEECRALHSPGVDDAVGGTQQSPPFNTEAEQQPHAPHRTQQNRTLVGGIKTPPLDGFDDLEDNALDLSPSEKFGVDLEWAMAGQTKLYAQGMQQLDYNYHDLDGGVDPVFPDEEDSSGEGLAALLSDAERVYGSFRE